MKRISLLFVLVLAMSAIASANIIPTWTGTAGSGTFTWSYQFQLSGDQNAAAGPAPVVNPVDSGSLTVGSFLTIYDFAGYKAGSCVGATGWTCTAQLVGYTPSNVIPDDSAAVYNITWTYTSGSTVLGAGNGVDLGVFTAQSSIGLPTSVVDYASRGIGSATGTIATNVGTTYGPSPVPEPVTMALIGTGLLGLGLLRRKTRKN